MSQLYLVECPKCKKGNIFYAPHRERWVCHYCGYDEAWFPTADEKRSEEGGE